MDISFEDEAPSRHPGQGEPVDIQEWAEARWVIKPHICLSLSLDAAQTGGGVKVAPHDPWRKFVIVEAQTIADLLLETPAVIWEANGSGALLLRVRPMRGAPADPALNLTFTFQDKSALLVARLGAGLPQPWPEPPLKRAHG